MKTPDYRTIETKAGDITLRPAVFDDADSINRIMAEVYEGLSNKDLFVVNPPEWVNRILNTPEEGFAVVGEKDGQIVSFFFIWYPGNDPENLGPDMGLAADELHLVAHAESTCVLPSVRGNHLEKHMLEYAETFINPKEHPYLMATVSPDNPASYKSAEANGYKLLTTKMKYGGVLRRVYLKKLS